ncbi:MAG: papain-like cysteine protease family protein [Pseudomonadales bacterium]
MKKPNNLTLIAGVALIGTIAYLDSEEGSLGSFTGSGNGWPAVNAQALPFAPGQVPPPVDLPIENIPQETQVWCWAAVAQQIIKATKGIQGTPPQCALVGMANGQHPQACCQNPGACVTTGSLQQIQGLVQQFGGRGSQVAQPTDPMTVYSALAGGHAVVMAVRSSPYAGHVVVLRGMAWQPTPAGLQPVLFINDPMAYFTQPVPFANIARYWEAAIVIR